MAPRGTGLLLVNAADGQPGRFRLDRELRRGGLLAEGDLVLAGPGHLDRPEAVGDHALADHVLPRRRQLAVPVMAAEDASGSPSRSRRRSRSIRRSASRCRPTSARMPCAARRRLRGCCPATSFFWPGSAAMSYSSLPLTRRQRSVMTAHLRHFSGWSMRCEWTNRVRSGQSPLPVSNGRRLAPSKATLSGFLQIRTGR